jgi:hypothetical protein
MTAVKIRNHVDAFVHGVYLFPGLKGNFAHDLVVK